MKRNILFAPAMAALLFPAMLAAHGVEASRVANTEVQSEILRFTYSTGEAMSFAVIRAYAPSRPDVETVQSITDRNGYFSFVPDEAGEWRISVEDGMGHKGAITVPVGQGAAGEASLGAGAASGETQTPLALRILLGLSLIANIFAVYCFALKKRAAPKESFHHAH
jgi:nickel transport protein